MKTLGNNETTHEISVNDGISQRGFTLIETMVAMAIFTIVLASIMGLLEVARKARFNSMERGDDLQEVRIGTNQMAYDALDAGVNYSDNGAQVPNPWLKNNLGISPVPAGGATGFLTPVIPGPGAGTVILGTATDQVTFVSEDPNFNPTVYNNSPNKLNVSFPMNITGINATGPVLTVPSNAPCSVGDIYMINNSGNPTGALGTNAIGMVTALNGTTQITMATGSSAVDPLGLNGPSNGSSGASPVGQMAGTLSAGATKINMVTYLVVSDGTDNGTGTLIRRVYGGKSSAGAPLGVTDSPLAFNVTGMTIQYVLASGVVTSNPASLAGGATNLGNIRQLTVNISVRSARIDPQTNKYYTATLTRTLNTRNLGYEKS